MKTDRNIKTLILILCLGTVAISAKASDKDIVDTAVSAGSFNAPPPTRRVARWPDVGFKKAVS